jgi:hypothetical protein
MTTTQVSYESVLEYNGVRIRNCQTARFSEIPVMDPSGQNQMSLKTTLRVVGYLSATEMNFFGVWPQPEYVSGIHPETTEGAAQHYALLHSYLNERRKKLYYYTTKDASGDPDNGAGFVLHQVDPAPSGIGAGTAFEMNPHVDVSGGPIPKEIQITKVTGNKLWRIEFEVEFSVIPGCDRDGSGNPVTINPLLTAGQQFPDGLATAFEDAYRRFGVLSNRWSCTDDMNEDRYLVRTFQGQVKLSNPSWNPQDYRILTVPPLTPGMRREKMSYRASEDGLTLGYTIVDKEVTITAPPGSTGVKISHNEVLINLGTNANVSIDVSVRGERTASKESLARIAGAIMESKAGLLDAMGKDQVTWSMQPVAIGISTQEGTDQENEITMSFRGIRHANKNNGVELVKSVAASVYTRTKSLPGSVLEDYNNQRSHGNRDGEVPLPDIPIPSLAALHSALTSRCSGNFTMEHATQFSLAEVVERSSRTDEMFPAGSGFNVNSIFGPYYPELLVEISETVADFQDPILSQDHYDAVYTTYKITTTYEVVPMTVVLPYSGDPSGSAGDLPSTAFIRMGADQYRKRIDVVAERYGAPPLLPLAKDVFYEESDDNSEMPAINKLIDFSTQVNAPELSPGGYGRLYTFRAQYVYSMNRKPKKGRLGIPETEIVSTDPYDSPSHAPFTLDFSSIFSSNWSFEK